MTPGDEGRCRQGTHYELGMRERGRQGAEETVDETALAKVVGIVRLEYGGEIFLCSNF